MALKQKNDKKKISIDFTMRSVDLLEQSKVENYESQFKISNSFVVNQLIESTLGCPLSLKKEIVKTLNSLLGYYHLQKLTSTNDLPFLREELSEHEKYLENLISIFGGQNHENWPESDKKRLIHMIDGRTIKIPVDWIVLNEDDAEEYTDAFVLECSNTRFYGLPHFLMFYDSRAYNMNDKSSYSKDFEKLFYKRVLKVYPEFQIVLDNQVETRVVNGRIEGLEEWGKAPIIAIFPIKTSEEISRIREWDKDYVPPLGIFVNIPE